MSHTELPLMPYILEGGRIKERHACTRDGLRVHEHTRLVGYAKHVVKCGEQITQHVSPVGGIAVGEEHKQTTTLLENEENSSFTSRLTSSATIMHWHLAM